MAADEELWVLATDRAPTGGVALPRTAVWFAWDALAMSPPLYERVLADDPYADQVNPQEEPRLASFEDVAGALPDRYAGVLERCWGSQVEEACIVWEAPIDTADLPDATRAEALVRELVAAGFFVDAAGASWAEPLRAYRFTVPGGGTGVQVIVRPEGDELVARVMAL